MHIYTHTCMHIIPLCAPNYVMGLDSSPDALQLCLWTSSFSTSLCLSISLHRFSLFPITYPTLERSLSFQLWLSSLSLSLLCVTVSFLISVSVTFCLSSRLSLPPVFPFLFLYLYFLLIWLLSLSLSIFSQDHPNYFKFSVIPTSVISQDWHLVTDSSILPCCDVPGSLS